ncbi:hypothetical protein OESDEN_10021 [Oesophagostomum dentatum]|uniref:Uncharacterized protein n=1 Tax=Oesophagostomum dentatum TaxID=61180 RepID=A0A0B1T465_OESDE|nr:hypothetical protein OESDEN_10021 [Oesophagostomum dentatum]
MSKKKRSAHGAHSKESRRSPPRSPLPKDVDVFTPLSDLVSDHEKLAATAVAFVGWSDVATMLPPCLQACHSFGCLDYSSSFIIAQFVQCILIEQKGRSREDVELLVSDELDGLSRRRILRMLQGVDVTSFVGEDGLTSSSSSELSEDEENGDAESVQTSNHNRAQSSRSSMHSEEEPTMQSRSSSQSNVNANNSGTEGESFSDIELIEGLDVDASNLPDVSGT